MRVILSVLLTIMACLAAGEAVAARLALIVANQSYADAPLNNPLTDAKLVEPTLRSLGFDVRVVTDADLAAFDKAITDFATDAKGAEIALFYFAGHGFAISDGMRPRNYLMATDARIKGASERVLRGGGIPLDEVVATISTSAKFTIVFVDACRNNPAIRSTGGAGRGLARLDPIGNPNIFIGLSTRIGDIAQDGDPGEGSPFAQAFSLTMARKGLRLDDAFTEVRKAVEKATSNQQRPEIAQDDLDTPLILTSVGELTQSPEIEKSGKSAYQEGSLKSSVAPKEPLHEMLPAPSPNEMQIGPDNLLVDTVERLQMKHTSSFLSVAFSPDGSQLIAGDMGSGVTLWDASSGKLLRTMTGHWEPVLSVAFSGDGKRIVSGGADEEVKVWDPSTGDALESFQGHRSDVSGVAFSPDGSLIATAGTSDTVRLWDASSGWGGKTLRVYWQGSGYVAFSPDGSQFASASKDNRVRVWDVNKVVSLRTLDRFDAQIMSLVFSNDGSKLAAASQDGTVRIWNAKTGIIIQNIKGHTDSISSLVFSKDGKKLASGSLDGTVKIWDTITGALLRTFPKRSGGVTGISISPDGTQLAVASLDKTIIVWGVPKHHDNKTRVAQ